MEYRLPPGYPPEVVPRDSTVMQESITYTPGLNETIFTMDGMDGRQWGLVFLFMAVVFIVMETEKCARGYIKDLKYCEEHMEGAPVVKDTTPLPAEVKRFGNKELAH